VREMVIYINIYIYIYMYIYIYIERGELRWVAEIDNDRDKIRTKWTSTASC
jgi:hypothetical protein